MLDDGDGWMFSRGDVVVAIEKELKWVVLGCHEGDFIDGTRWQSYSMQKLEDGRLTTADSFDRAYCDSRYVKLGRWDFTGYVEVDDDEE